MYLPTTSMHIFLSSSDGWWLAQQQLLMAKSQAVGKSGVEWGEAINMSESELLQFESLRMKICNKFIKMQYDSSVFVVVVVIIFIIASSSSSYSISIGW